MSESVLIVISTITVTVADGTLQFIEQSCAVEYWNLNPLLMTLERGDQLTQERI